MHDPALQLAIFGRMALAAALGFLVGFEREARRKAAGERTIALVAAGAAAFASLASEAFPQTGGQVLAGVATGVGFLGIGVIWRGQLGPARGLTTAAATWTVAATGVLAGVGFYLTAILATAITMLILELEFMPVIGPLLHQMAPGSPDRTGEPPDPEHG
ncbi:MAG: MgtC/SapB family protein [Actinomycetota bacterium]